MEGPSLVQCFHFIISLVSLAYTFTVLHAIQYSMQNHDDSTTQNPQGHDLTHYSALSSTHDTLATTSTVGTAEKTSGWWTEQEIDLLLNYVERNSILTTAIYKVVSLWDKKSGSGWHDNYGANAQTPTEKQVFEDWLKTPKVCRYYGSSKCALIMFFIQHAPLQPFATKSWPFYHKMQSFMPGTQP